MADGGQMLARAEADHPPPQASPAPRQTAAHDGAPAPGGTRADGPQHGNGQQHDGAHRDGARHDGTPAPVPPIAPDNPALAHPANAPVRAAAMAQLQRGVGNHAVQAMLGGAAPRAGPDEADETDSIEAPEEQPEEQPEAKIGEAKPLALRAEPIRADYLGEPALQPDQLRFPPAKAPAQGNDRSPRKPPATAPDLQAEAGDLAVRRHAEVLRTGETLHEAALAGANQAVGDAVQGYQAAVEWLDACGARAALWLDTLAEQQRAELDGSAVTALRRLDGAAEAARATVLSASREGLRQIDLAAGKAAGGLAGAIAHAVAASVAAINTEKADCETASDKATGALTAWQNRPDTDFPKDGPKLAAAKNELRRKRVPVLAKPVLDEAQKRKTDEVKAYDALAKARPGELQHGPAATAMHHANASFRSEGRRTIQQTEAQAMAGIAELARSGRRTLLQMRRDGRGQLAAQRQAAHARLELLARGRRASLHAETASSLSAFQAGAFSGLALFARAPGSLRTALREAAPRGPDAVLQIARTTPPGIEAAMANARRLHGDRVAANTAAMRGTAVSHEAQHEAEIAADQARVQTELPAGVAQSTMAMTQSAETGARSLAATAAKVGEVATELVTGFSNAGARQLASATRSLAGENKNFAGETPKPAEPGKTGDKPADDAVAGGNTPGAKAVGDKAPETKAAGSKPPAGKTSDAKAGADNAAADGKAVDQTATPGAEKLPEPKTLGQRRTLWQGFFSRLEEPEKIFGDMLHRETEQLQIDLKKKLTDLEDSIDANSLEKAAKSVRGITAIQGPALQEMHGPRSLQDELLEMLENGSTFHPFRDAEFYNATVAYLQGRSVAGTRYELQAARGVFSADFARVEEIMGSLSPEDRAALVAGEAHPPADGIEGATLDDIREHLSGTDLKVFNALADGHYAQAEALKRFDKIEEARRKGAGALMEAASLGGGPMYSAAPPQKPEDHRAEVVAELAKLVPGDPSLPASASAADKVLAYVTKPMEIYTPSMDPDGMGGGTFDTVRLGDDQRTLLADSIRGRTDPVTAKVVGLHEELGRNDGPRVGELASLLIDKRLDPIRTDLSEDDLKEAQKQRDLAIKERDQAIMAFAKRYGGPDASASADSARLYLESQISTAFKDDKTGADFTVKLAEEGHPTPAAAAIGLDWAIEHPTTIDASLVHRILSHMDRDEIERAKTAFKDRTGHDLLDRLGVYGHGGIVGGLSGDDRLQAERDLFGVPRNQKEDLELQHFAIEQQRNETGTVGKWFASGTYGDKQMKDAEAELLGSLGKPVQFDKDGHVVTPGVFDGNGKLAGGDPERLKRATEFAPLAVQSYTAAVDRLSEIAVTVIAVLGAIAAAVITVVTAGAAGPLIVAALVTGLATMVAKEAIKGGRYGWKEAAFDLGMTAVQMLTAGVGAGLGAASRGGMAAIRAAEVAEEAFSEGLITAEAMEAAATAAKPGQLLGTQIADHALIGATTGAIGGAGQAAFSPDTWKEGGEKGAESVIFGLFRGALGGLVTSMATQKFNALGGGSAGGKNALGAIMGGLGKDRNTGMLEQMLLRGGLKAASSGVGAMAGRSAELSLEAATGHFRGNADDAFGGVLEAGWQAAGRGFGEGAAEAPAARHRAGMVSAAAHREYGGSAPPARPTVPETGGLPPRTMPGSGEPGAEPPAPRMPPEEPVRRPMMPRPEGVEPEAADPGSRVRPPRTAGEPPDPETVRIRPPGEIEDLPDQTVIRGATPHDIDEARLIYGNTITDSPGREAAIYFNPETGEYVIVQGEATTVAVGAGAAGELEAPQPAGVAQRWKEVLDGGDAGRWELVSHFHPAEQPGGNTSLPRRLPSGQDGDFATIDAESVLAGDQPRNSRIHYLQDGRYEHTDFGVDPTAPAARYWVDYADPVTGARSRETFATIAQYHAWFEDAFGFAPSAARAATPGAGGPAAAPAPPRLPDSGPPPRAIRDEIDTLLIGGPAIEHPPAEAVAGATRAFRQGTANLGDFEILLKQAAADARLILSTKQTPAPGLHVDDHAQYQFDLAEMSWYCLTGACGTGRDNMATSLATFLMDAETAVTIRRYQAMNVFEAGQHGFAVVEVPGEPPARYLLDPTFAQFMRPTGRTFALNEATANFLSEHPEGAFMARDLLRSGYLPLTEENATLYARAMGVAPAEAAAAGARLFQGDRTDLTEQVGGPQRLPPVTRITSNIDTLSGEEVEESIGRRMNEIEVRDGTEEAIRQRLSAFRERVAEAVRRGPVLPEQERMEAATQGATPPVPEGTGEGPAAAGIATSPTFRAIRGGAEPTSAHIAAVTAEVPAALDRLAAAKAMPDVQWERVQAGGPPTITVARGGRGPVDLVTVSFRVGDTPGGVPASFPAEPTRNAAGDLELVVTISRRHPPDIVEQAIAHEITEIAHRAGAEPAIDRLAPGGGKVDANGPIDQLSGHDRGRLAQIATITRQIAGIEASEAAARLGGIAGPPSAEAERSMLRLRNEAELLAAHLGLVHGVPDAVQARRTLALRALANEPEAARLLEAAIATAPRNPLLELRTGTLADLDVLARRRALAIQLGQEEALAPERVLLGSAENIAVAAGIISRDEGAWSKWTVATDREQQAQKLLSDEGWKLLQAGMAQAASRREATSAESAWAWEIRNMAGSEEQRELVRQRFADRPRFQELDEFIAADPQRRWRGQVDAARMRAEWMQGKFITESGLPASLVNTDQPDLGFRVLPSDMERVFTGGAKLSGPAAAGLERERSAAIKARDAIEDALKPAGGPAPAGLRKAALEAALKQANSRINKMSELLGVSAGDDFARRQLTAEMPDLQGLSRPMALPHDADASAGANTIDLGFESAASNTLVVIECKGGTAERITRRDITGQLRVEQGTREYLEAVAAEMASRGATQAERDYGQKLLAALQTGSMEVRYYQVRQPINRTTGAPEPYIVDEFDIRPRRPPGK